MKIKEIHLVFENCEVLKIPYIFVKSFRLDHITDSIIRWNGDLENDNFGVAKFANSALFQIDKSFNVVDNAPTLLDKKQLPFDRMQQYNDISTVCLIDIDRNETEYYMNYDGLEINKLQKTKVLDNGDIFVCINKNKVFDSLK